MEAKAGMIGILDTWTQKMDYHPHLHCIIPSGGITEIFYKNKALWLLSSRSKGVDLPRIRKI
jgi:hypothetical protein